MSRRYYCVPSYEEWLKFYQNEEHVKELEFYLELWDEDAWIPLINEGDTLEPITTLCNNK